MTLAGGSFGFGNLEVTLLLMVLYFAPAYIAHQRKHPQENAVFALDLLLGWTFIGWCVALVWALTAPKPAATSTAPQVGHCSECNAEVSAGAVYCPHCGVKF